MAVARILSRYPPLNIGSTTEITMNQAVRRALEAKLIERLNAPSVDPEAPEIALEYLSLPHVATQPPFEAKTLRVCSC